MLAVRVQSANALLAGQETQLTLGKVEEGADAGVGLAVVVAERAFIVPFQLSDAIVYAERPVVAEGLVHFELDRFVFTLGVLVGVGFAVGVEFRAEGCALTSHFAVSQAPAVGKQVATGVRPRTRVDGREARASGWRKAVDGRKAGELVKGDEGGGIAVGVEAG